MNERMGKCTAMGIPTRATLEADAACVGISSVRTDETDNGERYYKAECGADGHVHSRHDGAGTTHTQGRNGRIRATTSTDILMSKTAE